MKTIINTKRFNKRLLLPIIGIPVLLIIALLTYVYLFNGSILGWPTKNTESTAIPSFSSPPTNDQIDNGTSVKQTTITNENSSSNTSKNNTTTSPTTADNLTVTFTNSSQDNGVFHVRSLVENVVSNTGSCSIALTSPDKSITLTAKTQAQSNYSTCLGFDISKNDLPSGVYQISLTVKVGSQTGTVSFSKSIMW